MIPGVVIDQDGRPICTEMWPGNTADVTVLVPMVDCLRSRFGIGQQVGGQIRPGLVLSNPNSVLSHVTNCASAGRRSLAGGNTSQCPT
jgi:hypothetical protein